jgi:FtsZ-interacting cell division protein ZipA
MKRNKIILGSVGIIAIAAIAFVGPWNLTDSKGSYEQKDLTSLQNKKADDARKWLEARYIDQETGLPLRNWR